MRNNSLKALAYGLLFLTTACEKAVPEFPDTAPQQELQTVTFQLKGFTSEIIPLSFMQGARQSPAVNQLNTPFALKGLTPSEQEQYLYFWSFNTANISPDIALNAAEATISFTATDANPSFTTGYGLNPHPAGKALSIRGLQELVIHVSLQAASTVSKLAFDVGSSGTGPKNFKLLFSTDNGATYIPLSEDNPFQNTKDNARNSYEFDLSTVLNQQEHLTLKLEPFAGERGEANDYNPNTGTFKMDNLRITGIYSQEQPEEPVADNSTIHYHIFHAEDHTLASTGSVPFSEQGSPEIVVKLPVGNYYASFVSNTSTADLLFPPAIQHSSEFYISNSFSNHSAVIFGATLPSISVDQNTEIQATLKRYFSEIKFEFTDDEDLSDIGKIVIRKVHETFAYAPFQTPSIRTIADPSVITLVPQFTPQHKSLQFHQFIGQVHEPIDLTYHLEVYDLNDQLIRTFEVNSAIKNNVQLLFKGNLLLGQDKQNHFQIEWNQQWDDTLTGEF